MSIRVIIADDESLMRSGLRLLLGAANDIEIIAEAADGAEAIELTRRLCPDLVLMDIRMPVVDGLEAAQRLLSEPDHPQVLMLTAFGTDDFVHRALQSGAAEGDAAEGGAEVFDGEDRGFEGADGCS